MSKEMTTRQKGIHLNSMTDHTKVKSNFLREIVKNTLSISQFLEGVENNHTLKEL